MEFTRLAGIGVVTGELDRAAEHYARLLDVGEWTVDDFSDDRLSDMVSHGRRTSGTFRTAFGETPFDPDRPGPMGAEARSIPFELVQPTGGETPFNEFLLSIGEGIAFLTLETAASDATIEQHFGDLNIPRASSMTIDGSTARTFWDTRARLGGYLLEVVNQPRPATGTVRIIDGASSRNGHRALPVTGINHFGVIVDDLMTSLEDYRAILGIQKFDVKTWQAEHGRLDAPYYRDHNPVAHGYFTAQGFAGDFGFEVIQVKYGPSHYNREFTDQRGPGIHHVFPYLTFDSSDWDQSVEAMTALGAPLCMGSDLRAGAAEYGYFDTFDTLGGFLIEGVIRRSTAEPKYMAPDWTVDFTTKITEA
ncbi:MAG TPA: hypothetical protein GXZ30_14270 [Propionibacterium sp.]|nr:hypothetical protein [Propionibacterium sp.]